jgi:PAX-interacting protein 1
MILNGVTPNDVWNHGFLQPMPAEQLQKLKHYKDVLHRMIPYLRVPQDRVPKEFNVDKVDAFEKQIVNIMETFKRRRQGAA